MAYVLEYQKLGLVVTGIATIVGAIGGYHEEVIDALEKAEILFSKDEIDYIRGEYKERYL